MVRLLGLLSETGNESPYHAMKNDAITITSIFPTNNRKIVSRWNIVGWTVPISINEKQQLNAPEVKTAIWFQRKRKNIVKGITFTNFRIDISKIYQGLAVKTFPNNREKIGAERERERESGANRSMWTVRTGTSLRWQALGMSSALSVQRALPHIFFLSFPSLLPRIPSLLSDSAD